MVKNAFLVCMGGSGHKLLEALIHMAAMGVLEFETLHALVVDTDSGNGNSVRTDGLLKDYEKIRERASLFELKHPERWFRTKIIQYTWSPVADYVDRNATLAALIGNNQDAQMIARLLYSQKEMDLKINEGFRGSPNIGALFLPRLLQDRLGADSSSSIQAFVEAVIQNGGTRILLAGSCYGGTGASGIPTVARYLRGNTYIRERVRFGAFVPLPTFNIKDDNGRVSEDGQLHPDSKKFNDKVKTVLRYYAQDGDVLGGLEDGGESLYHIMYLLGFFKRTFVPRADGKKAQKNPATIFDWLGCQAVQQFFCTDIGSGAEGVYTDSIHDATWNWEIFSNEVFPNIRMSATLMLQTAAVYLSEVHTQIRAQSDNVKSYKKQQKQFPFLSAYFSRIDRNKMTIVWNTLKPFADYLRAFSIWIFEIMNNLPEQFPESTPSQSEIDSLNKFHAIKERDTMDEQYNSLKRQKMIPRYMLFKLYQESIKTMLQDVIKNDRQADDEQVDIPEIPEIWKDEEYRSLSASVDLFTEHTFNQGVTSAILMGRTQNYPAYHKDDMYTAPNMEDPADAGWALAINLMRAVWVEAPKEED